MKKNTKELYRVMKEANQIRKVLEGMNGSAKLGALQQRTKKIDLNETMTTTKES